MAPRVTFTLSMLENSAALPSPIKMRSKVNALMEVAPLVAVKVLPSMMALYESEVAPVRVIVIAKE